MSKLVIDKNFKLAPHTLKEIMEVEQRNLWLQATESVKKLTEVQKRVVELLPEYRKQLPSNFEGLDDSNAQSALKNHIRLRSLYALTEMIWEKIEEECKVLANCSGHNDSEERDAQEVLQTTLTAVEEFPFDSIIDDNVTGLLRFNDELKIKIKERLLGVYKNWSFDDIIGTINRYGIKYEQLWKSAIDSQDPQSVNLKDLLDDDTMVRVY
ncbi:hypothetical protein [Prevotella sp. ne3005]|uniref:hypothetical protein n=1 Tax=Prevotella sp. ne3005 TaxID=1761887 RepID=UPI000B823001|nr:hypothetical protein [Prevotella sp. ne3005]